MIHVMKKKGPVQQKAFKPYDPATIEKKWQKKWETAKLDRATEDPQKKKFYGLIEFPYPSGQGLHVGHIRSNTAMDIISRKRRREGFEVLYPIGWDAFGLPTENYAIKTGIQPAIVTKKNTDTFRRQLKTLGFSFDWSREIDTTDPAYYRWTQWIFLRFLEKGLAYKKKMLINWCPKDLIGLANEEVVNGRCERCGTPVEKREKEQWMLAITKYADRLLDDLDARVPAAIPLFVRKNGEDAAHVNAPFVERWPVVCIIKHWSDDKYLCVDWKHNHWHGFVTGGIDEGESPADAAVREIKEETGYTDARFVREIGKVDSQFYQAVKKVNRFAHFTAVYIELASGNRVEVSEDEKRLQDDIWVSPDKMHDFITHDDTRYVWDLFTGAKKQETKPLLDWSERIKEGQRNWIGRSSGVNLRFKVKDMDLHFEMYDSIPQTFMAQTFTVIAPEHPAVYELVKGTDKEKEVMAFVEAIKAKKARKGFDHVKDMEGIFTGRYIEYAPAGRMLPIWVASYALADYGSGIVNCSYHDERDYAFAKKYGIPLHPVLFPEDEALAEKVRKQEIFYREPNGVLTEPAEFRGRRWDEARSGIISFIVKKGWGTRSTQYKLRDWIFSRQRYWGEPIPVIHCPKCGIVPVPDKDLPVKLPVVKDYQPTETGESPLAAIDKWVNVKCPKCKGAATRETDTMPNWAGSSWYYLRYADPKNSRAFADPKKLKYWTPVDWYNGGMEHTTLHLLYSRFWHKFLYDIGLVPTVEPYLKRTSHGLILAEDGEKMSKSKGNVINPDDLIRSFGADSLRLYEMFMGPFEQAISWNSDNIVGVRRFIERVWKMRAKVVGEAKQSVSLNPPASRSELDRTLHKAIKKVTEDIEAMRFNTAVSALMIATNELEKDETISRADYEALLQLLAPFAPHVTDELWASLGNTKSIHVSPWPSFDPALLSDDESTIILQINGKTRGSFMAPAGSGKDELEKLARESPDAQKWLRGKEVKRIITVPGKLVNIVAI